MAGGPPVPAVVADTIRPTEHPIPLGDLPVLAGPASPGSDTPPHAAVPVARVRLVIRIGRHRYSFYRVPIQPTARTGDVMRLLRRQNEKATSTIRRTINKLYWRETIEQAVITINEDGHIADDTPAATAVEYSAVHSALTSAFRDPELFLPAAAGTYPSSHRSFAATYGRFLDSSSTAHALLVGKEFKKESLLSTALVASICGLALGVLVGFCTRSLSAGLLVGFGSGTFISLFSGVLCFIMKKE